MYQMTLNQILLTRVCVMTLLLSLTCSVIRPLPVVAAVNSPQPTIAILEEGDAGDGFINQAEAGQVVVSGNTTLIPAGQIVRVLFSNINEGIAIEATATVDSAGQWTTSATNITAIPDGVLEIIANVRNNEGIAAGEVRNTVNLVNRLPRLTVQPIARSANRQPLIKGTTDQPDGATVNVSLDTNGMLLCDAIVAIGVWQCQASMLAEGQYLSTARVADLAGNIALAPFGFEIDADLDDDGIADAEEGTDDFDGDLIPNNLDLDSDGDAVPDFLEGTADLEMDGRPNYLDVDSDNDGILDGAEVNAIRADADADGIDDAFDVDVQGGEDLNRNGISDYRETLIDTDADGVPDVIDLDSDNDTLFDVEEAGLSDLNQDGYLDSGYQPIMMPPNSDFSISGDAIADFRDLDSNNDGVTDLVTKGQFIDLDSGVGQVLNGPDSDADGIVDAVDRADFQYGSIGDSDLDGVFNDLDLDDDNDGLADTLEGAETDDADGDGIPNRLDLDSDNDSIPDGLEGFNDDHPSLGIDARIQNFIDVNGDGLHDLIDPEWIPIDSDGDLLPDFLDVDSDDDTLFDLLEADVPQSDLLDQNVDGRLDLLVDEDRDGLMDVVDLRISSFAPSTKQTLKLIYPDSDQDGARDFRDTDSDADGYGDAIEKGDFNNDGNADWLQNDGNLDTAVTGYGSFDAWILAVIIVAGFWRVLTWLKIKKLTEQHQQDQKRTIGSRMQILMFSTLSTLSILFASMGLPTPGYAFTLCESGQLDCVYVGVSAGFSEIDPEGNANGWQTRDDSQTGWSVYAGAPIRPHWFGEVTYGDLGAAQLGNVNPNVVQGEQVDYSVITAQLGYSLWAAPRPHNFFTKVGVAKLTSDSSSDSIRLNSVSDLQISGTIGWLWKPAPHHWFARVHYDIYDRDAHFLGLSIGHDFNQGRGAKRLAAKQTRRATPSATAEKKPLPSKKRATKPRSPISFLSREEQRKTCRIFEGALQGVRFENNSSTLTSDARVELNKTIETLKRVPELIVEIQAYTDDKGSAMYNQWLSERRALAVLEYLTDNGLADHHFKAQGYGESFPIASNSTDKNRALNRRVQFQLINEQVCR